MERPAAPADTLLPEENRPRTRQPDREGRQREERSGQDEAEARDGDVDEPLHHWGAGMERGSTDVHQCKPEDVLTGLLREEARAGKRWNDIGVDRKPLAELESLTEVSGCTPVERDDDPADREFLDRSLQSGVITNDRRQIGY